MLALESTFSKVSLSLHLLLLLSSSPSRVPAGLEELSIRPLVHGLFGAVCTAHRKLLNPKPILHVPGGYFGPSGQRHAKTIGILEAQRKRSVPHFPSLSGRHTHGTLRDLEKEICPVVLLMTITYVQERRD